MLEFCIQPQNFFILHLDSTARPEERGDESQQCAKQADHVGSADRFAPQIIWPWGPYFPRIRPKIYIQRTYEERGRYDVYYSVYTENIGTPGFPCGQSAEDGAGRRCRDPV